MSASASDYFLKATPVFSTTIGAGGVASDVTTTIPLTSVSNLPTDTGLELVINRVDSNGDPTNNYETVRGIISGMNLANAVRGVEGTAQAWAAGVVVEMLMTADMHNRMVTGIVTEHNQDGTHGNITQADGGYIKDTSGNEFVKFSKTASAVNEFTVKNAATGNPAELQATGGDTNIDLALQPKGTGALVVKGTSTSSAEIRLSEDTDNGTNYVGLKAPASTSNLTFTLPSADGSSGQSLVTNGSGTLSFGSSTVTLPQGGMLNGKIVASVASNNITLALKGADGNDPSASNIVYVRIGNTVRSVTSALSVTKNAGTNWFGSGGAMFAAKEVDYFAYIGYNATDGVVIGFARIPYASKYGDFSATSTAETYCAISTITTAGSTDEYEVVGRFNAILSASASYNWSIPGTAVVISRPIYETRWLSYLPTYTGFSSAPTNANYYKVDYNLVNLLIVEATQGTSNATTKTLTLPLARENSSGADYSFVMSLVLDNSAWQTTPGHIRITNASPTAASIGKAVHLTAWTSSGTAGFAFQINYPIVAPAS